MKIKIALVSIPLLALSSPVFAQDTYVEVGVAYNRYALYADTLNINSLTVRVGRNINDYIGVEGDVNFGLGDGNYFGNSIKLKYDAGAYLVGRLPLSDSFELIGRVGLNTFKLEDKSNNFNNNQSNSGASVGIGGQFNLNDYSALRFGYTRYKDDRSDSVGISFVKKF